MAFGYEQIRDLVIDDTSGTDGGARGCVLEICTGRAALGSGERAGPGRAQHGPGPFYAARKCHITFLTNTFIIRRRNKHQVISCFSRRDAPVTGVTGCGRGRGLFPSKK